MYQETGVCEIGKGQLIAGRWEKNAEMTWASFLAFSIFFETSASMGVN